MDLDKEKELVRLINRGWFFGAAWIMGIGSVVAITSAIQAWNIFNQLRLTDMTRRKKIIKNLTIGIIGLIVWIPIIILLINRYS